ncbi:MAG: NHL repeat-containing protein [Fimbriimonadaceae bacterium]|nr:NHL repeat-containing protein [Fimbriimonadaceae bacterium]
MKCLHLIRRAKFALALLILPSTLFAQTYWVSSYNADKVDRYDASGNYIDTLAGSFNGPQGITIGQDGLVYIADEENHRVVRYNQNGTFHSVFITAGLGGLSGPTGVTFNNAGEALVASFNGDSVLRYSSTGSFLGTLVAPNSGGLNGPDVGITVGPDGNLLVPSFWNGRVNRYDINTGAFLNSFVAPGSGGLISPRTMLFHNGLMYLTDDFGNKINRYNSTTGAFVDTIVTAGSGGLNGACGLILGPQGQLLVTSLGTNSVKQYNATTGAYLGDWISPGNMGMNGPTFITKVDAVPEPITLLAAVGILPLLRRRKR